MNLPITDSLDMVPAESLPLSQLYDRDILLWVEVMADLLRQGKYDQLDFVHLIEEVEDLGKRERDRFTSSIRLILHHLLKWQFQPSKRSRSWQQTIQRERLNLENDLQDTPSLVRVFNDEMLIKLYGQARKAAAIETELPIETFPLDCPYGWDQIQDDTFFGN